MVSLRYWFIMHLVISGADDEGTLNRLKAHRRELIDPKITEHHGRIPGSSSGTKTTGDGFLVEFASVVDAVRCAVEVQQAMRERNASGVAFADSGDVARSFRDYVARCSDMMSPG
jgi:class 3 adenylate cyclase